MCLGLVDSRWQCLSAMVILVGIWTTWIIQIIEPHICTHEYQFANVHNYIHVDVSPAMDKDIKIGCQLEAAVEEVDSISIWMYFLLYRI